jgi:hypothetical protein
VTREFVTIEGSVVPKKPGMVLQNFNIQVQAGTFMFAIRIHSAVLQL